MACMTIDVNNLERRFGTVAMERWLAFYSTQPNYLYVGEPSSLHCHLRDQMLPVVEVQNLVACKTEVHSVPGMEVQMKDRNGLVQSLGNEVLLLVEEPAPLVVIVLPVVVLMIVAVVQQAAISRWIVFPNEKPQAGLGLDVMVGGELAVFVVELFVCVFVAQVLPLPLLCVVILFECLFACLFVYLIVYLFVYLFGMVQVQESFLLTLGDHEKALRWKQEKGLWMP